MSRHASTEINAHLELLRDVAKRKGFQAAKDARASVAKKFEVSDRTVRNWLRNGAPETRTSRILDSPALVVIAVANGQMKKAHKLLVQSGDYSRCYEQFTRDVKHLDPIIRTAVRSGVPESLKEGLYLQGLPERPMERVIFDHTEVDVRIRRVLRGNIELFRPWVSFLLDSSSRMILGWLVTEGEGLRGDPGTESLVELLASAIHGSTAKDGTFVGGIPDVVQCDNAKAHLAEVMIAGLTTLGISLHTIHPGSPWEDGKVERLMRTFNDEFVSDLPGYIHVLGDRYNGVPWKPEDHLEMPEFMARLRIWVETYNYAREHDALKSTPFDQWKANAFPRRANEMVLRGAFRLSSREVSVSKNGVRFRNLDYTHADLEKWRGKKVKLRYLNADPSFVDVWDGEAFICTALLHHVLSNQERANIVRGRRTAVQNANLVVKESRQRRLEKEISGTGSPAPENWDTTPTPDRRSNVNLDLLALAESRLMSENGTPDAVSEVA
jgi:transposase InsO family protein